MAVATTEDLRNLRRDFYARGFQPEIARDWVRQHFGAAGVTLYDTITAGDPGRDGPLDAAEIVMGAGINSGLATLAPAPSAAQLPKEHFSGAARRPAAGSPAKPTPATQAPATTATPPAPKNRAEMQAAMWNAAQAQRRPGETEEGAYIRYCSENPDEYHRARLAGGPIGTMSAPTPAPAAPPATLTETSFEAVVKAKVAAGMAEPEAIIAVQTEQPTLYRDYQEARRNRR
jgi:hypothetical protein